MKTKKRLKKIPYYLLLAFLTLGASIIVGFLSFTGMFTLVPLLSLAVISFLLSVGYEGEIFQQNIRGALNKLYFKPHFLERHLAKEYLFDKFSNNLVDTESSECPQFIKDYVLELKLLKELTHKHLDKASKKRKKQVKKTLSDMEKWFATQLFSTKNKKKLTPYEADLRIWLDGQGREETNNLLKRRQITFRFVAFFSVLAGLFMGVGTTYLLLEAIAVVPLLAGLGFPFLPALIVPLAIIAGAAYTMLIYNAVTDMINNDSLREWVRTLRAYYQQGLSVRTVFITFAAVLLLSLTVGLTICTAGTWWTIIKNTPPLFRWMHRFSQLIVAGIVFITGIAQFIFNFENTSVSLGMIDKATQKEFFSRIGRVLVKGFNAIKENENWLQWINFPRLILKLTFVPLRLILFLGHIISNGVNADRLPGIPQIVSAILGIISEGFEDMHYFLGDLLDNHDHEAPTSSKDMVIARLGKGHGHDHNNDIPTQVLRFLFSPLYYLAAGWDYYATRLVQKPGHNPLSWQEAWDRQTGQSRKEVQSVEFEQNDLPSKDWTKTHAIHRIDRHIEKNLTEVWIGKDLAFQKKAELKILTKNLRGLNQPEFDEINDLVEAQTKKPVHKQHRHSVFFFHRQEATATEDFLETQLLSRISPPVA